MIGGDWVWGFFLWIFFKSRAAPSCGLAALLAVPPSLACHPLDAAAGVLSGGSLPFVLDLQSLSRDCYSKFHAYVLSKTNYQQAPCPWRR